MITIKTTCKFPGIACRVQPWVIHLIHARWQIASNLLSRASVTVGRAVAAPCRTHCRRCAYCANVLGYRQTTRDSNGVQEKRVDKSNVPVTTKTHNFARKLEETRSRLDDSCNYHRNVSEATVEVVCARVRPSNRKSLRILSDECG